ncbi:spore germination protein [Alicyclobacillus acidocaldarius]|uniref:GerA spore germination protein n=1 Tax=Alicyclobacillus acidocaldarius (strain Tc-4-1) TaxID=1048834 RepID=F8IET6_ALIAT|nr:spore germination protein [Alicyclobacillus acidocaldarius]AEJ43982.1 GerA spore germination protein [Alicyclobacillus acidocaldarius subsp. acidocaldarius Tc-4-1]
MHWFKSFTERFGFTNPVRGRYRPRIPSQRDMPTYTGNLDEALKYFRSTVGQSDDFVVRIFEIGKVSGALLFYTSICDKRAVEDTLRAIHRHRFPRRAPRPLPQYLVERVLTGSETMFMASTFELKEAIAAGKLVLLLDVHPPAIVISAKAVEHRAPDQPILETSTRGSQVAFVENIDINLGMIRQYMSTDTLVIKRWSIGVRSHRVVAMVYVRDIANPILVETVSRRLDAIHTDIINGSAAVEQRIVDHPWSLFSLVRMTSRVDGTCMELNQGKVAIVVDGDPTVLLAPATFQDFFQTVEDYMHTWWEATFMRVLRVIAFVLAVWLPALYIAFVDYSPDLLPKTMALQIAQSRQGVPFPAVMEVIIMQLVVEILREATLRMPRQMGQAISIVGGLVVGEATVQAGIVSNVLLIVVALSAVSVFVTPSYEFTVMSRLGGWVMIIAATLLGFYGVVLATIWTLFEICNLHSFGIPYVDPLGGDHVKDTFLDGLVRLPITVLDRRPEHLHPVDTTGDTDLMVPMPNPQLEKWEPGGKRPQRDMRRQKANWRKRKRLDL